jgi:N-acetylneuraminate synthase
MDRMVSSFEIQGRMVGPGHPCFVIAEAGVNHNGDYNLALKLIDAARDAGADAVKFQTFKAERLTTDEAPMADYQTTNTGRSESQFDMLRRLEMPDDWHVKLKDYCEARGLVFMSTPFDEQSATFLHGLGMAVFKVPSGELINQPYLEHIAAWGKPMIVSTGMGTLAEVDAAMRTIAASGAPPVALLQCVSSYPAAAADVNLRAMHTLQSAFQVPAGYSDHTNGTHIPLAAVALGACIIEKHLTLDRDLPGPDHKASIHPSEFAEMMHCIREIESSLGNGHKLPSPSERNTADVARKSLVAAVDIPAGTSLTRAHISTMRPGTGLPPALLPHLLGCRTRVPLSAGTLITMDHIGG